ncbi:hypothetical protein [Bacillus sp. JJ1562]|uniref:hypothetical protein n=1 Tax=Bacillus sp. JJ1562 TaxID=3122960 RepID=UPI00300383A3
MKKLILITGLIGVICLGFTQILPVLASEDTKVKDSHTNEKHNKITKDSTNSDPTSKLHQRARDSKHYGNITKELGISTNGKDTETIQSEIKSNILQQKAKETGIDVEGKSEEELITEMKEKYSEKPELTEAPSNKYEELRMKPDSRRNQIIDTAKQHGIETEGKEFDEIVEQLKTVLLQDKNE